AGDVVDVFSAGRRDLGRFEHDLRELVGVEEVGAAEMLVTVGNTGVDGGGLDDQVDRRGGGIGLVDVDHAGDVGELAAHFGHEVADAKHGLGVAAVDVERVGRGGERRGAEK